MRDPSVDVVAVCVPPFLHAEVATAALAAGKHVYVEKPLAVTLEDAARIRDAARAARGLLTLGFNLRSHRLVLSARERIAGGTLGALEMMRTSWTCGSHLGRDWPAWRLDRTLGGGAFNEIAVHHLDLARFLLGDEIESIAAMTRSKEVVDQDIGITARMRSGVVVGISVSQKTVDGNEVEVYGRRRALAPGSSPTWGRRLPTCSVTPWRNGIVRAPGSSAFTLTTASGSSSTARDTAPAHSTTSSSTG